MKLISVVGARPQFIKLGPLSDLLKDDFEEIVVHTGQHFDENMSDLFFNQLAIKEPKYNLGVNSSGHGRQTGEMLIKLEEVFEIERPDLVIVFGDTTSTLAGALSAVKLGFEVLHIEAGLRSFNRTMPEEINRIVADHTSDFLFAPTQVAMKNLNAEGLLTKAFFTGDIMVNSLIYAQNRIDALRGSEQSSGQLNNSPFILATFHRPYNVDDPSTLQNILNVLGGLETAVIFPVHPRTRQFLRSFVLEIPNNIRPVDPLGYLEFVDLQRKAELVITDSGGIQKEAYILNKPCVTMRSETEWVETVEVGWNLLLNPKLGSRELIDSIKAFSPPVHHPSLFGDNPGLEMLRIIKNQILK